MGIFLLTFLKYSCKYLVWKENRLCKYPELGLLKCVIIWNVRANEGFLLLSLCII